MTGLARGIGVGLVISLAMWAPILGAFWWMVIK